MMRGDIMQNMNNNCRQWASAHIKGGCEIPALHGTAKFQQTPEGVLITVRVSGLPDCGGSDFFALHIHEGDGCGGVDFSETGSHYDPCDKEHPCHAGDLPPLLSCKGKAYMSVLSGRFRLKDIIGRTLVIHSHPDDFHTQPAGNAGKKIACGLIC